MDAEEIQNRISAVSRRVFKSIVGLVLREIFSMQAIDVDGSGDGGNDWLLFTSEGRRVYVATQDTIQHQGWVEKAIEDAISAQKNHRANRYLFCTNRPHHQTTVTKLEDKVTKQTGMSATVFEARRLAELIHENRLVPRLLEILGEGVALHAPSAPEMAFWAFSNFSADRADQRNQIFEDTIICVIHDRGVASRSEIVAHAMEFLGCSADHASIIDRRVDALLVARKIVLAPEGKGLALGDEMARQVDEAEKLYLTDWTMLTGTMSSILEEYGAAWTNEQAEGAALFLARWFVSDQMGALRAARASVLPGAWTRELVNPEQKLRDLLQGCGIPVGKLEEVIEKLADIARGRPAISKLTRTAVFAALEGANPLRSAQALGASSWSDVSILLDASVAIPVLCSRRTEHVDSYLFALSSRAADLLETLGATLILSPGYLEECASHLLRATRYEPVEIDTEFSGALSQSENAFVSYYYALRQEGRRAPDSLRRFLSIFVENITEIARRSNDARAVMPDVQGAFSDYGIAVDQLQRAPRLRFEALLKAHDLVLDSEGREKAPVLRRHDVAALAHVDSAFTTKREAWMLLTWDRALIRVGAVELRGAWVLSPVLAMQFAQPCRRLSDAEWSSLAHKIARISDPKETLTARILDEIVKLRHELLQDWEFRDELRRFRNEAALRAPIGDEMRIQQWVDKETAAFVASRNLKPETPQQIEIDDLVIPDVANENPGATIPPGQG